MEPVEADGFEWYVLDLNPEPWAIGPVGYARRGGKMSAYVGRNTQLAAYQEAVREELGDGHKLMSGYIHLKFFFSRNIAEYKTPQSRTARKHEADLTNLQKATEDALQGVLFKNDKDVKYCESFEVAQGMGEPGFIIIGIAELVEIPLSQLVPDPVLDLLDARESAHHYVDNMTEEDDVF